MHTTKKNILAGLVVFFLSLFIFPEIAGGAKAAGYFVSVDGNDSNAGTSSQPFQTIQKGINAASPGDEVVVMPGVYSGSYATYGHAEFNLNTGNGRSGQESAPITIKAQYPATEVDSQSQKTIIQGPGGFGFYITNVSYIVIDGFEIIGFQAGIGIHGSEYITVRRNILRSNTAAGIENAPASNSIYEYNQFLDPGPSYPELDNAIQDYGINFYTGSANNQVVHNYFFGKHNQALSWKRKAGPGYAAYNTFEGCMYTCLYIGQNDDEPDGGDMTSYDVTVEYNVFRDAVDDGSGSDVGAQNGTYYRLRTPITIRNAQNTIVRNNFVENSLQSPVYVIGCEGGYYCQLHTGREPVDASIYGNTFVNTKNYQAFEIMGRGYSGDDIDIFNNTIYNTSLAFTIEKSNRGSSVPTVAAPNLRIINNNFVNVGNGVSGDLSTTYFSSNNWYDFSGSQDNRQSITDVSVDPLFVGPLDVFNPNSAQGPTPFYTPSFLRANYYKLTSTSTLIDAGEQVGLSYQGLAPDISSNEFIFSQGEIPTPTLTPSVTSSPTPLPTVSLTQSPTQTPTPIPTTVSNLCSLAGDVRIDGGCDGVVDDLDYQVLLSEFGELAEQADFNGDGFTNILDFTILSNNYSTSPSGTATLTSATSTSTPTTGQVTSPPIKYSDFPYPRGSQPPFGFLMCEFNTTGTGDDSIPCIADGFTVVHNGYWGSISGEAAGEWAQDAVDIGIQKIFFNTTPFDLMRDYSLSNQYTLWKSWFEKVVSNVGSGTIAGYYLPDEPEPGLGEYEKVKEIMKALKDTDPQALGLIYDGGVNPVELSSITKAQAGNGGVDVILDGGYPVHHPEYGGHGWVYARLREIESAIKDNDSYLWMVTEAFGEACADSAGYDRTRSHVAMGITAGAQGVFTYGYAYANPQTGSSCYNGMKDFLPLYKKLWPWIMANTTSDQNKYLNVNVTSGSSQSPTYNLSIAKSYSSVQASLLEDASGDVLVSSVNLYEDQNISATINGVPDGTYEVWDSIGGSLSVQETVTVENGQLEDIWGPYGYKFYIKK